MNRSAFRATALLALLLALVTSAACGGESDVVETEAETDTTSTWITGETREPIPDATSGQTVLVSMAENGIAIPTEVTPGPTVFTVTNAGTEPHQLAIAGGELESSMPSPVPPGGTDGLDAVLTAGKLQAWCAVEGHRERGEWAELTVTR